MDRIMRTFHSLQRRLAACEETSSSSVDLTTPIPGQILNDSVYQVCQPAGPPLVEIVFFHGLNLDGARDVHLKTWLSAEGSKLWLEWILEEIPQARILSISYDSFAKRTSEHGLMDMHLTCENLVQDLIAARVGQGDCPVVLVGHCIGCLVIKELCATLDSIPNRNEREEDLLLNVKGLFYYACPHQGSELADESTGFSKGSLFEEMTTLNKIAQRRNENFRKLREKYRWRTYGIQEGLPTTLEGFKGFIVQEASARHGVDGFYTDTAADHFSVCRPGSTTSSSFRLLLKFVTDLLEKDKEEHSPKFDTSDKVGLKGRVKTLTEKLDGSQRLGIVGMGGSGKTTLAMALYNIISRSFEYTAFVPDVKEFMTSKSNQLLLQEKIIGVMDRKGHKVDKSFSWQKLTGKKVLIVLDDVEFTSQVQVMTKLDDFSKESRIIVTSRDSGFLSAEGFDCYSVPLLEPKESKELLCLGAFNTEEAPSHYKGRVWEFVDKCGGLPLTLTVVGKYLYGVNEGGVWDDALKSLRRAKSLNGSQEDELWSCLRVSYDSLAPQEKEMFLDVAICFNGADLEMVKKAWKVCGWVSTPDAGLKNLVNKGLITIVSSGCFAVVEHPEILGEVIRMHEVLRDLGRSIARPNPENIARHSRLLYAESDNVLRSREFNIWESSSFFRNKPHGLTRPQAWRFDEDVMQANAEAEVQVLSIDCRVDFNIEELRGLNELKILWIGPNVRLYGPCSLLPPNLAYIRCDGKWFPHPEGLYSDITESVARMISYLSGCSVFLAIPEFILRALQSSSILGKFRRGSNVAQRPALRYLEIRNSVSIGVLDTLGDLQALQSLEIYMQDWKALPESLSQLRALEYLVIEECTSIRVIPDSLGDLQNLQHLRLPCRCGEAIPTFLGNLRSLGYLEMTGCHDWTGLMVIVGQLITLQKFVMKRCRLCEVNDIIGQLAFLESLNVRRSLQGPGQVDLPVSGVKTLFITSGNSHFRRSSFEFEYLSYDCEGLRALPGALGNLQALEELTIEDCENLEALPDSLGQLSRLRRLHVLHCKGLRALPGTLGNLQALEELTIEDCENLEALPDSLGQLSRLRRLHVLHCKGLRALPGTLGNLQALEKLTIEDCENLEVLPDSLGQLSRLRRLHVLHCKGLRALPGTLGNLQALEELTIEDCLEALPDSLGQLSRLRRLHVLHCKGLRALPGTVGNLQALEDLTFEYCQNLVALPDSLGELPHLRRLRILWCKGLRALPGTLGSLQALEDLTIEYCRNLVALPDSLGELPHLRRLHILCCEGLRALPGTLGNLQALEDLTIEYGQNLVALPDSLGELPHLRRLRILWCKGVTALPGTLGSLQALEDLTIEFCRNLVALPDSLGELPHLRRLHILCCEGLRALPGTLGSLQALENLLIRDCKKLATLPDTLGDLPRLRHIDIHSCKSLKTLPGNLWQLPELSTLVIEFCENLESFPDAVDNQHSYPSVIITTCNKLKLPPTLEELLGRRSLRVRYCRYLESRPVVMSKLNRKQGQEPSPPKELRIRLRERP